MKKVSKKLQNTKRLATISPILLNNLTFYPIETMLKPTEISKKSLEKIAKLSSFGKNCKNFKFSSFWKKLAKSYSFG